MCLDYIETHGGDYEQVLTADTRDVIFQGDVFESFKGRSNYLGYSTETLPIGKERKCNYPWLVGRFGKEEADKIADKKIICCGTVIGTVEAMKIFCRMMWDALKDYTVWGYEQAAMNYFVWNNLLPIENVIELDVHSGEILTNGTVKNGKILGDKILRGDGGVPSVIHQYDWHKEQVQLADRLYRDKNFQADVRFNDARSILEQMNQLFYLGKTNDAARLCINALPDNANFYGNADRLLTLWQTVLQKPLTPAVGYLELRIQDALQSIKNFSARHLEQICSLLVHADKNNRGVLPQFKFLISQVIINLIERTVEANAAEHCFHFMKLIETLNMPPNKNFYLLAAKAYRVFGRKAEAIATYQKAIDLS